MNKLALIGLAITLFACAGPNSNDKTDQDLSTIIQSPFTGDFYNDTIFQINPTIENIVETPNGSSLIIPANILVDANGNTISDQVDVSFIQYHSAADVIASGIPMNYDSAGTSYNFETAGMFSLNAESKNRPVFVKEGDNIKVNLASDKNDDFNFYSLNEQNGDWTYEHSPEPVLRNPRFDRTLESLKPEKKSNDAFVLDLNFDYSNYGELQTFSGIVWEYVGKEDSLDPRKNKWVSQANWLDFELVPTYDKAFEYYLTMTNKTQLFTTKVKAALSEEEFEAAMSDYQEKQTEFATKKDELQKPYIRSVEIAGFGTYNYDYICKVDDPVRIVADFEFDKYSGDKTKAFVFLVYPESQMTVQYPAQSWHNFGLDRSRNPKLLAVLPNNKLAVYTDDIRKSYEKDAFTYHMTVLEEDISSKGALEKAIAQL